MKSTDGKALDVPVEQDGKQKTHAAGDNELRDKRDAVKYKIEYENKNRNEYGRNRISSDGRHQKISLRAAFKNNPALGTTVVLVKERLIYASTPASRANKPNAVPQSLPNTAALFHTPHRLSCQPEAPLSALA